MAHFVRSVQVWSDPPPDRDAFPFVLPALRDLDELDLHPEVTFFIGENGSGKSTLLEAIAVNFGFPAEGGTLNHKFSTHDSHSDLHEMIRLAKTTRPPDSMFLRAESFYNVATYLDQSARLVGRSPRFGWTHQRSHGEGFLDCLNGLKDTGLYLLDEPESALSLPRQFSYLVRMREMILAGSQFIIATHSPILLGLGRGWIYQFSHRGIERIDYRETDHYQLTLDFLRHRERYEQLLGLDPIE